MSTALSPSSSERCAQRTADDNTEKIDDDNNHCESISFNTYRGSSTIYIFDQKTITQTGNELVSSVSVRKVYGTSNIPSSLSSRFNTTVSTTNIDNNLKAHNRNIEEKTYQTNWNVVRFMRASLYKVVRRNIFSRRFSLYATVLIPISWICMLSVISYHRTQMERRSRLLSSPQWIGGNAEQGKYAVFYHIYIGSPEAASSVKLKNQTLSITSLAYSIIEEQLLQVGTSFAASSNDLQIFYNTIGDEIDSQWLYNQCSDKYNMTCTQLGHFQEGFEDRTLNSLKNYCDDNPTNTVIYLHNKGSFHPGKRSQTSWRRAVTAATTSKLCMEPMNDVSQCNVCGLMFHPLPGPHFPGNMWTAKCSYIKKLLLLEDYHIQRLQLDEWIKQEQTRGTFYANLFPMERHYTGQGRYEAEQWIGGHPSFVPCDVSQTANLKFWLDGLNGIMSTRFPKHYTKEFKLALAPRHSIHDDWLWYSYALVPDVIWMADNLDETTFFRNLRLLDYFLLRGVIARWNIVYNQLPNTTNSSSTNWIWSWFPDGEIWRNGIDLYGADSIYEVIKNVPIPIIFNGTTYSESSTGQATRRKMFRSQHRNNFFW